jgi:hypothetical protein
MGHRVKCRYFSHETTSLSILSQKKTNPAFPFPYPASVQRIGAIRAVPVIFLRFKTTSGTAFFAMPMSAISGLYKLQILFPQRYRLSPGNPASQIPVNRIKGTAAAAFDVINPVPPEDRKKKQAEAGKFHIYFITAIPSTDCTDHRLTKIQIFPTG